MRAAMLAGYDFLPKLPEPVSDVSRVSTPALSKLMDELDAALIERQPRSLPPVQHDKIDRCMAARPTICSVIFLHDHPFPGFGMDRT